MIICPKCKRVTKMGEPTGKETTLVYINSRKKEKGIRILKERTVCMNCNRRRLL